MTELRVENMSCGACVANVTRAVKGLDPDATVAVDLRNGRVQVDGKSSEALLVKALNEAGYPAAAATAKSAAMPKKGGCCCG